MYNKTFFLKVMKIDLEAHREDEALRTGTKVIHGYCGDQGTPSCVSN